MWSAKGKDDKELKKALVQGTSRSDCKVSYISGMSLGSCCGGLFLRLGCLFLGLQLRMLPRLQVLLGLCHVLVILGTSSILGVLSCVLQVGDCMQNSF